MAKPKTKVEGNGALPSGSARLMALVERSQPSQDRPRISEEFERQLRPVHAKSAACYASMEDLSDQIEQLARRIDSDEGVVVDEMDEDANSVVNHIEEIRTEIHDSHSRLAAAAPTPPAGTPTVEDDKATEAAPASPARERALTH